MHFRTVSLITLSFALAACGGGGGSDAGSDAPVLGTTVEVGMADYEFTLSRASVPAGTVTFHATNMSATMVHEMVIAATDLDPGALPTDAAGAVDEAMVESPGEIAETDPGADGTLTLDLAAGNYVLFCNVENHYSRGMRIAFTVTP